MFTHLVSLESASWFPWLLDLLVKSAVLLALAGVASLACWRASAAQRHLLWLLAVVGVLLLPVLAAVLPAWQVVRVPEWRPSVAPVALSAAPVPTRPVTRQEMPRAATPVAPSVLTPSASVEMPTASPIPAPVAPPTHAPTLPWYLWVTVAWGMGSVVLLARWAWGVTIMRRIRARAVPAPAAWTAGMAVRVRVSDALATPVVMGGVRPTILLPAQAGEWPEERRRVVLLHELAHVQRRDLLAQLLAQLACALYWPNPLIWLAAHRLRLEREHACDDAVLRAAVKPSAYAVHLLAIAATLRHRPPLTGIAMARSSKVGQRIIAVLDARRNRRGVTWWGAALAVLIMLPLLVTITVAQQAGRVPTAAQATVTRLPIPTTVALSDVVISPNGEHVAFIDTVNGKRVVVIDGKPEKSFGQVRAPWFDRSPMKGDDRPYYSGLFFSPDGTRLAYAIIRDAGRHAMVIDGEAGSTYSEVSLPVFSPDSKHVAYAAKKTAGWVVVLDGKELGTYEDIGGNFAAKYGIRQVRFNPQDNSIAYAVRKNGRWHVMAGGKVGSGYDDVANITFSPRGQHLVYMATFNETMIGESTRGATQSPATFPVPVIDGKERWDLQGATLMSFSPDDRRLAAVVNRAGQQVLLVDNQAMLSAPLVLRYRFSPDSQHVACVINNGTGNDSQIFVDGEALPYTSMGALPVYSQDGTRMADVASVDGKQAVIVDGKQFPSVDGWIDNLTISPDGKHVVYQVALKAQPNSTTIVVDGIDVGSQQGILGSQETSIVSEAPDRTRTKRTQTMSFFDAPNRFHYFAVKDGVIERVEVTIPGAVASEAARKEGR